MDAFREDSISFVFACVEASRDLIFASVNVFREASRNLELASTCVFRDVTVLLRYSTDAVTPPTRAPENVSNCEFSLQNARTKSILVLGEADEKRRRFLRESPRKTREEEELSMER